MIYLYPCLRRSQYSRVVWTCTHVHIPLSPFSSTRLHVSISTLPVVVHASVGVPRRAVVHSASAVTALGFLPGGHRRRRHLSPAGRRRGVGRDVVRKTMQENVSHQFHERYVMELHQATKRALTAGSQSHAVGMGQPPFGGSLQRVQSQSKQGQLSKTLTFWSWLLRDNIWLFSCIIPSCRLFLLPVDLPGDAHPGGLALRLRDFGRRRLRVIEALVIPYASGASSAEVPCAIRPRSVFPVYDH